MGQDTQIKAIYKDQDGIPRVFGYGNDESEAIKQATLALSEYLQIKRQHGLRISSDCFSVEVLNA